ncbi:thioredoxin fold domain-containing protein [filamentous cyanobacterium LEGE 11480]|uniref:Thioredoxin fold domain-containing protein n=1 Tax=Romeriopsis navalis LEGE 11480 TaxID=2777977 RepID=A0A928VNK3_9CYAN|nr:thioredoxin domain-containing protein [Romeriopsis navalis]MBE9029785.1 thioredoxin fold domain-containing protein [Romeriopsis navalis LEGE 11480]
MLSPIPIRYPGLRLRQVLYRSLAILTIGLCVSLGLFGYTPPAQASGVQGLMALKHLAKESVAYDVAIANGNPTLIEFYADWCTSCQSMAPTMAHLHEKYGDSVNFVMLDIDDPQWAEPVAQFAVQGVPQLTLLTADATPVDTLVGKVPESIVTQLLELVRA